MAQESVRAQVESHWRAFDALVDTQTGANEAIIRALDVFEGESNQSLLSNLYLFQQTDLNILLSFYLTLLRWCCTLVNPRVRVLIRLSAIQLLRFSIRLLHIMDESSAFVLRRTANQLRRPRILHGRARASKQPRSLFGFSSSEHCRRAAGCAMEFANGHSPGKRKRGHQRRRGSACLLPGRGGLDAGARAADA